jgi:hypothetical protein
MLIALDHPVRAPEHCHDLELRWLASVNGAPAAHHTLRSSQADALTALVLRGPLPRWSATAAAWGGSMRWSVEVRPRVLRDTDPCAAELGVTETAAALVIVERGTGPAGVRVEHELVVLAAFASAARRGAT